jgi:phosphoribosylamine--glycine ligase
MKVLVVGGGGREHALAWRLTHDPTVTRVFATPGNAGIAQVAECMDVRADDVEAVVDLVDDLDVDLTVIGPEAPLVAGLADAVRRSGRAVFGPSADAARIEGSKAFAKDVMARRGVPTARSGSFIDVEKAVAFVDELGGAAVVKADGLAAGKGVTVATDRDVARAAIEGCLVVGAFGDAGRTVVVEEILEGPEVSVFAVTDGKGNCVLLPSAQDHKRIGDGDTGPNTGGMGAYSPVPTLDQETETRILDSVIAPVVDELRPYRGVLFAGMMLTADGPKVLEFNCRFGDPETEVLLPRMPNQVGTLLHACATGRLAFEAGHAGADDGAAVTVVMASGGYPGPYETGKAITGVDEADALDGVTVFHAGTERADGRLLTAGGRVLSVTGTGATIAEARERAYAGVGLIDFEGAHWRRDIAARAAEEEA